MYFIIYLFILRLVDERFRLLLASGILKLASRVFNVFNPEFKLAQVISLIKLSKGLSMNNKNSARVKTRHFERIN